MDTCHARGEHRAVRCTFSLQNYKPVQKIACSEPNRTEPHSHRTLHRTEYGLRFSVCFVNLKLHRTRARQSYVSTKKRSHSHTYTSDTRATSGKGQAIICINKKEVPFPYIYIRHKGHFRQLRQGPGNHINIIICINKREAPIITGHTHKADNQAVRHHRRQAIRQAIRQTIRQSGRQSGNQAIRHHRRQAIRQGRQSGNKRLKERPHIIIYMIHQTQGPGNQTQGSGNHIIICINKREAPIITGHTQGPGKLGNQASHYHRFATED